MAATLLPLEHQVIVITGPTSGIGLATARAAAAKGAKMVLAARSERRLVELAEQINLDGGEAIAVPCDVSNRADLERVATSAIARFGRIDTWINNAGLALYGRLDEVSEEDSRRVFDVNFWGLVNGSLVALPYLKQRGGALINVGSEVSEATMPLLGMYAASKQAVKGFTDSLRIEIEEIDKAPVAVTLIQPCPVNTPLPRHAGVYQRRNAQLPGPMIEAKQVADAVLYAATNPTRTTRVGLFARINNTNLVQYVPTLVDEVTGEQVGGVSSERDGGINFKGTLYTPTEDVA